MRSSSTVASWTTGQRFSLIRLPWWRFHILRLAAEQLNLGTTFIHVPDVKLSSFPLFCFSVCVIDLTCLCSSNEGIWSNEGCVRSEGNVTYSVCLCNHLTNFAILMQVVPLKVGLISGYFPVSKVRINVAPSSQVLSALHRWASAQESAKQWWFCFAQPCKNGVNYRLVSTASTHSFKNKHLFKMYLFCSSRCILLSVFINFARLWCLFLCAENCTTALSALHDGP